jgi:protein-S-isoprenylcysteine O-methyltransferase Ste14
MYRRYATNAVLVVLFSLFAWANLSASWRSGAPRGIGLTVLEGFTAVLFLFRREPAAVSGRFMAWVAAPVGTFAMLLARPGGVPGAPHLVAELIQLVGIVVAIVSLGVLGRSFGLVAAHRGLRTGGPYRFVRHPAYLGYLIAWLGYVAENPSTRNLIVLALGMSVQVVRMHEEERLLEDDPDYRHYKLRVPSRLIPYVY